jgi:integrase
MAKDLLSPTNLAKMENTTAIGRGLYVIVRGGRDGSKSYGFRRTLNGTQLPMMHFKPIGDMTPVEAWAECERCNELIKKGIDPRKVKAKEKRKPSGSPAPTVATLLDRYFEQRIERRRLHDTEGNQLARIDKARRYFGRIGKKIGPVLVADVDTDMLIENFPEIEESLSSKTDELCMFLRRAFDYAVARGWRKGCDPDNPVSQNILDQIRPHGARKRSRRASLSYLDAPRFVAALKARKNVALGKVGNDLVTVPPLLFLIYTGVRTMEVRNARWGEIDWDNLLWNVPKDHRKKGYTKDNIRAIPISAEMLAVLNAQKRKTNAIGDNDFIFPGGARDGGLGKGVLNEFIKNTLKWDVRITVHGFRATLTAWATAERRYPETIIKRQFDHLGKKSEDDERWLPPSMIAKHYSHSEVDPTIEGEAGRREMTERYDAYLDSYKGADNE